MSRVFSRTGWGFLLAALASALAVADEPKSAEDPAALEFFEAKVRPILVEKCQSCHNAEKLKGGLRLDSREAAVAGGPTGPAVVPGKPDQSLLVDAINYGELKMPPRSKLAPDEIATLTRWVESGAAWPASPSSGSSLIKPFNLAERARHWSLQPVAHPAPLPVHDTAWSLGPIDRFLLAKLEAKGIRPAAEASKTALIRRLTFDLTGLPPTPAEVEAYLDDRSPDAYERVVDRLLGSPRYGERWARHWLDLVRYAETSGHEFDYEIPMAYRYRDYLIRAFNADVPFDRFVLEHVAGDLLPDPRRDPVDGSNQSILGTGFFRLHEGVHSPVDLRDDSASRVDSQVDVLGKAFLGLTLACARCHDHKFDAITTKDYYALTGFLKSSRHQLAFLDPPDRIAGRVAELERIRGEVGRKLGKTSAEVGPVARRPGDVVFEDFSSSRFEGWYVAGEAFGQGPTREDSWKLATQPEAAAIPLPAGVAHSGAIADRLHGTLRSRTFPISRKYVHYLAAGRKGRINLVVDGFEIIRDPIYGTLVDNVNHGESWRWVTQSVASWLGHPAYVELDDGATVDFANSQGSPTDGSGFLAVDEILFSDDPAPPVPAGQPGALVRGEGLAGLEPRFAEFGRVEASIPEPTFGQTLGEGTGIDARVFIRGNPRTPGDVVPRRFLEVFGSSATPEPGSGRLELARAIADPKNPLTARVLVNRLWHHHFGRGIVPSVDDFGKMGRTPTHPELLDWLATRFIESGWSIKTMQRLIVTSRAYRMSSQLEPVADQADASNELWHRREVRRLEAEAIRDAILAVSGRLDDRIYGPSVAPHLTPFMDGRGRPGRSGPLDGDGRRSLYINVRRNFLDPMLLAFDFPTPASPMGRRNVSNVPAQALTLLNDPLLLDQARHWATRIQREKTGNPAEAIDQMYREAFARPATLEELHAAQAFLDDQAAIQGDPRAAWTDLAHVLLNVKEFIVIE
jgi:mono/diheme cytochrome c family protein